MYLHKMNINMIFNSCAIWKFIGVRITNTEASASWRDSLLICGRLNLSICIFAVVLCYLANNHMHLNFSLTVLEGVTYIQYVDWTNNCILHFWSGSSIWIANSFECVLEGIYTWSIHDPKISYPISENKVDKC